MSRIQAPSAGERIYLDGWCSGPRMVLVTIRPVLEVGPFPVANLDLRGAPLHVEWEGELRRGSKTLYDRLETSRETSTGRTVKRWRSNAGTFCCRTAAKLFAVGGSGMWDVEVEGAPDEGSGEARSIYELQRFVDTRANPSHVWSPEGHTHLECLAGTLSAGGVAVAAGKAISLSIADKVGWEAQGIIRSYVEI